MTLRGPLPTIVGLAFLLCAGLGGGDVAQAQDRGAPRFGSSVPSDTIEAEASDAGRIWSLVSPPVDRFAQRYGAEPDSAWATHLRRSVLRLPGCAGAFVSADGLVLTTARCVRHHLDENFEDGVVADRSDAERSVPGLHADRLVGTSDVTAEVRAARQDTSVGLAGQSVEQRLQSSAGAERQIEVSPDAEGGYMAHTYRRYEDIRLVFLPERAISAFGGIDAAMTYPRQAVDVALLRVHTPDGRPMTVEHYLEPSSQGVRPGDVVFAAGPSAATHRAESAAQLAVRRDVVLPERRDRLDTWIGALQDDLDTGESTPVQRSALRDAERTLKKIRARLEALQNEYIQVRLDRRDAQFQQALREDPALQERYGGLLDSIASVQGAKRELSAAYRAFGGGGNEVYASTTYRRVLRAEEDPGENSGSAHNSRLSSLRGVDSLRFGHSAAVETAMLSARLEAAEQYLQPDTAALRQLLGGQSPRERAASVVEQLMERSSEDPTHELPADGPVAEVAAVIRSRYESFSEQWQNLERTERRLTHRLSRARQAVQSMPMLSGGGAPRLTDGRVLGYPYNGTTAPPFTTVFGLYEQTHAFGAAEPWSLPERWQTPARDLDRSVPLNFVASVDGAVSNNGAPLVNPSLGLVGMAVGPNIQGVAGTYLFLPERMRTVAMDIRGLREVLRAVYEADALVDEVFGSGTSGGSFP